MKVGVCVVTAILAAALLILPAPAHATVTSGLAFECTANFPAWPSSITRPATCGNGLIPSLGIGGGLTTSNNHVVVPSTATVGGLSATFDYQEICVFNELPEIGTAQGIGAKGFFIPVTVFPGLTSDVLHVEFTWTRVGATLVIVITKSTLSDGTTTLLNPPGAAIGTFVPLLGPTNTCAAIGDDGGPMQAIISLGGGTVA